MPRCLPNPDKPGFDRCGQRSAAEPSTDRDTCYYCRQALVADLDRQAQKRRGHWDDGVQHHHAAAWGILASDQD
jgi:hypothetical protein